MNDIINDVNELKENILKSSEISFIPDWIK